ncbi:hypothetical protein BD309DRAFT_361279 [Dichomitus squalens]|nr:hypothetical protein BD309DRAFT_361279 [Dichomitus squalens]
MVLQNRYRSFRLSHGWRWRGSTTLAGHLLACGQVLDTLSRNDRNERTDDRRFHCRAQKREIIRLVRGRPEGGGPEPEGIADHMFQRRPPTVPYPYRSCHANDTNAMQTSMRRRPPFDVRCTTRASGRLVNARTRGGK